MPARVRCPTCETALTAPDEVLGSTVRCEACGQQFTAKAPPSRRRLDDDEYDRPARRPRFEDEDDEDDDFDRPRARRRVRPRRRTNAAPFVFAGIVFLGLAGAIGGLFWYFTSNVRRVVPTPAMAVPQPVIQPQLLQPPPAFQPPIGAEPQPAAPPPAAGQRVTLSNPRWSGPFNDFEVDYTFRDGRPFGGIYTLVFRSPDGSTGSATLHGILNASGTARIHVMGFGRAGRRAGPLEIWMAEGMVMPGPRAPDPPAISNRVTLN
jgi:hypothetical protein